MMLVLHGWGQTKQIWQNFVENFSTDEARAIDLPGFGSEPLVSKDWGVPEYGEWVQKQIEQLNPTDHSIILLGHSFGGRIAAYLASQNPSWLKAVILCGTPALYRPDANTIFKIKLAKLFKRVFPFIKSNRFKAAELIEAEASDLGIIFRNTVVFDQTNLLPRIKVPTLLLWGSNDLAVPLSIAREMHDIIAHSQLQIISGAGHQTIQESPYLTYAIIKNFLAQI